MWRVVHFSLLSLAMFFPSLSNCFAQELAAPALDAAVGELNDTLPSMPSVKASELDFMPNMTMNGTHSIIGTNESLETGGVDMFRDMIMGSMNLQARPGLLQKMLTNRSDMSQGSDDFMNAMGGIDPPLFSISGWTDMSYTASTSRISNLPVGFNDRANEFLLQQNWLRIEHSVDEVSSHPSFGFRSDWILPGSDYRFTLPRGIWNSQLTNNDGKPNTYGIDSVHFYGDAYFPGFAEGLDIKVGRFGMLNGVEMNDSSMNLLSSHAYTYLADPFTHTGILTSVKLNNQFILRTGITTGSDIFFDSASRETFVGGVQWTSETKRTIIKLVTVQGPGVYDMARSFDNRNLFDAVLRQQIGDILYYTLDGLYGYEYRVPGIGTAQWYSMTQYLTYEWSKALASTARLEFFDDKDGERTAFPGLYTGVTTGLRFQPSAWFNLRPEIRYDISDGRAFEGRHGLFTATTDVIVNW